MDLLEIYNDDCFNIFPKINDKSIDLFVLDLPYANKKFGNHTSCKWDTPINLAKMWEQIKRIMKNNSVICFFCNAKLGFSLIDSNPDWFRYDLVWFKKNRKTGYLNCNRQQLRNHENIYIFQKSPRETTYNPQMLKGKSYKRIYSPGETTTSMVYNKKRIEHINDGRRFPASVIEIDSVFKNRIHRTEKPVEILEYLINTYSNEGDTVMDFTMGSGSCGVACFNTKRRFIGIEKNDDIFVLAQERLSKLDNM
jgi:DNA modification methylase